MANSDTRKRLLADLKKILNDPPPGVTADLSNDNLFEWDAQISGPGDTPFEGGLFRLRMTFPPNYPAKSPTVFFFSRMFHPNVYQNGKICLDILQEEAKWNPSIDAASVLCAIQGMLGDPNPLSPANGEANNLFLNNNKEYERRVLQIVRMSEEVDPDQIVNLNKDPQETDEMEERNQLAIQFALAELNG